jgi:hypothetical protein
VRALSKLNIPTEGDINEVTWDNTTFRC